MEILKQIWIELGAIGILISLLSFACFKLFKYIESLNDIHRSERGEWRKEIINQNEKMIDAFNKNTTIMSELTTLIKNK